MYIGCIHFKLGSPLIVFQGFNMTYNITMFFLCVDDTSNRQLDLRSCGLETLDLAPLDTGKPLNGLQIKQILKAFPLYLASLTAGQHNGDSKMYFSTCLLGVFPMTFHIETGSLRNIHLEIPETKRAIHCQFRRKVAWHCPVKAAREP